MSPRASSAIIRALVYRGIPSDLRSRPSISTTFLGLCSLCDNRQAIESPKGVPTFISREKALSITIYDCILILRSKRCCSILISPYLILILSNVITLQHRNVATSNRKEVKISRWFNRHSIDQEAVKLKIV